MSPLKGDTRYSDTADHYDSTASYLCFQKNMSLNCTCQWEQGCQNITELVLIPSLGPLASSNNTHSALSWSRISYSCAAVTAARDGERRRDCTMWVKWSLSRGLWVTLSSQLAAVGLCGPPGQLCSSFLKPHVEDRVATASFSFLAGQACSSFQLYFRHTSDASVLDDLRRRRTKWHKYSERQRQCIMNVHA